MSVQVDLQQENRTLREELRLARIKAGRADQIQRDFIALAAHELRSPLAILFGYAKILASETEGVAHERAELVSSHAWHLKHLVDEILILQQIDAGELVLRPGLVDLVPIVRGAIDSRQREIAQRDITIRLQSNAGLAVYADRERLAVVIHALLSNACKYTAAGGHITVSADASESHVTVAVSDDGIGIAPEDQLHVFERFFQVGEPLTRRYKGLGLGLAIAQALVERMHGRIWVRSEPGCGSTFSFSLPSLAPSPPAAQSLGFLPAPMITSSTSQTRY